MSGAVPDLDVGLLNNLLSKVLPSQDTEHHAKKFRPRRGIEALESSLIALRHRGNQPDQLSWRQHSVPRNRAVLIALHKAKRRSRTVVPYPAPNRATNPAGCLCGHVRKNPDLAARVFECLCWRE